MNRLHYDSLYQTRRLRLIGEAVRGERVLDIGHAVMPNPYLMRFACVGYDQSPAIRGQGCYHEEIVGDVQEIAHKLAGRTFDSIVCGELIEHLENPYAFLRSLHALLEDDGTLVLSTPNPLGFPVFLCELFHIKRFFYTRWHTYYFLPRWVERLLNHSGYELCAIRPVGVWLPFLVIPWCPVALSYQVVYVARKQHPG